MKNILLPAIVSMLLAALPAHNIPFGKRQSSRNTVTKPFFDGRSKIYCSPTAGLGTDSLLNDVPPLPGWGIYRWKISTRSDSAQFYFNQGISLYYGFHIIEAMASFKKAAAFDPQCAMAFWGQALAYGPNINDAGFYQENPAAWIAAEKAERLSDGTTEKEQALIRAQLSHYTADTPVNRAALNNAYAAAMKAVYLRFNTDADASILYADALMNLHAWDFYNYDGQPKSWTPELTGLLEHTLKRYPDHPGAIHYYIHALEASDRPGMALPYARRLSTLMPDVSHMVHMASHIYIRTGLYSEGIESNRKAVAAFYKYVSLYAPSEGNSPLYLLHNVDMEGSLAMMAGRYADAQAAFKKVHDELDRSGLSMMEIRPGLGEAAQFAYTQSCLNWVRFGKWDSILALALPDDKFAYAGALWHFARGMALVRKADIAGASGELSALRQKIAVPSMQERFGPFNTGAHGAGVAAYILEGEIDLAKGNAAEGIALLQKAVDMEMTLIYNEPADWRIPARHYLGAALVRNNRAADAEKVFRDDLRKNPMNVWALKGLEMALDKQGKTTAARSAAGRFKTAAAQADVVISSSVF